MFCFTPLVTAPATSFVPFPEAAGGKGGGLDTGLGMFICVVVSALLLTIYKECVRPAAKSLKRCRKRAKRKWARYRRSEARRQAPPDVADERLELLLEDFETRFVDDTPRGDAPKLKRRRNYVPKTGNSVEGSLVVTRGRHARG